MSLLILPDKLIKQPFTPGKVDSRVLFANHRFSKLGISAQSAISSSVLWLGIADKFSGAEYKKTSLKLPDSPVTILIGAIQTSQTDFRYLFGTNYDGGLNEALTFRTLNGFLQLTSYNGGTNEVSLSTPANGTYNTYFAELNSIGSSSTTIGYINSSGAITKTSGSYARLSTAAYDLYIGSGANVSTPWRFYDQPILFTAVIRGKLTDSEKISITKNPWQIFEPNSVPFYFNTGSSSGATLTQSLRFDNSNSFYSATVAPGSVTLTASLFSNSSTIYLPTVTSGTLLQQDSRFDNTSSFYAPTVTPGSVTLTASLFTNTSTLYAPIVTNGGTLLQQDSRFDNTSTFYGPTVTPGTVTLTASLFSNTSTFYSPTVTSTGPQTLTQSAIFQNSSIFYSPTVSAGLSLTQADLDAIANAVWAKVIETFTAEEMYRVMFAALAGKRVGMGASTEYYMGVDGVTPRIEFSPTDADGNGDPILNGDP